MTEKLYNFLKNEIRKKEEIEIVSIDELKKDDIRYDRMHGRPSIVISLQGEEYEFLLDTGAKINEMSNEVYRRLKKVEIQRSDESDSELVGQSANLVQVKVRILFR